MERLFNQCEAVFWSAVAATLSIRAWHARGAQRPVLLFLAGAFLLFGMSDAIEAQTGAWWEPRWLVALKIACGIALALGFRRYYLLRQPPRPPR